jgi:hypothetical protein
LKRYVIEDWANQKDNPFLEHYPLMEEPISQPLPMDNPMPGDQTMGNLPQGQFPPNDPKNMGNPPEIPQQPPQDTVQGAGPVEAEPESDEQELDDEESPNIDFETEKVDYMDLAVARKPEEMMDKLLEMREVENLTPGQYKFIEDNIQILSLSKDIDFADLQRKVYKQIKDTYAFLAEQKASPKTESVNLLEAGEEEGGEENMGGEDQGQDFGGAPEESPSTDIGSEQGGEEGSEETGGDDEADDDRNNSPSGDEEVLKQGQNLTEIPGFRTVKQEDKLSGLELCSILSNEIEQYPSVVNTFLKMPNFYSMKADLFRKTIAAITNAVQIGTGGTIEDLFIPIAKDGIGIKLCTRIYTGFGNIQIGKWTLEFNDPEKYLSEPELLKLNDSGSPEEKEVLRKRVIIESISESYKDRIFIVFVVNPQTGERHEVGFNFSELVKTGWKEGVISIDFKANVGKGEAGIEIDGNLIDLQEIQISFISENADQLDDQGLPVKDRIELMKVQNGLLYLTIDEEHWKDFTDKVQEGIFYMSKAFDAGDEELKKTQRCIPDIKEILLRQC